MPKGIRKLQIIFGETHLTHFGEIFLIHHFCQKLKTSNNGIFCSVGLYARNKSSITDEKRP